MRRFNPQKLLAGSLLIASLVMAWLSVMPYRFHLRREELNARDIRFAELAGTILRLDEVLTMSARMAAATGDGAWEIRYRKHEPELDAAIKKISSLAPSLVMRTFLLETDAANQALVEMENSAFRLGRQGRRKQALNVLVSEAYLQQKTVYAQGLEKFMTVRKKGREAEEEQERLNNLFATAVSAAIVLVLLGAWLIITRLLNGVKKAQEQTARFLKLEHAVTEILAESLAPQESAPRIIEAVCSVLGWVFGAWWLIDRDRGELYCSARWHAAGADVQGFDEMTSQIRFKPGIGLPGRVWSSGIPAWIEDVTQDANFPRAPFAAKVGLHGACAFPIKLNTETLGVFEFFSRQIVAPDQKILETLASLGSQIGQRLKRMQADAHVMHIQKMDAIGTLAGGIAHDFNNNLSCILGLCDLVAKVLPPGSGVGDDIAEIQAVAQRSAALSQQLLSFSRKKEGQQKNFDANDLLEVNRQLIMRMLGAQFNITAALSPSPLPICVDSNQFSQVLMNLAVNARDAMPQGGDIEISSLKAGSIAEIGFKDNGVGIDKSLFPRLFDPFFTTKEPGKGTGLGLSIVHGIVTGSGGTIEVESSPGQGTLFRMRFPLLEGPVESFAAPRLPEEKKLAGEIILLVEDDPGVLRVTSRQLQSSGLRVLAAGSAEEAMVLFSQRSAEIGLVVTDINMPKTNGLALALQLRALRPKVKVLFISGYGLDVLDPKNRPEASEFLVKPVPSDILTAKVGEMLAGRST